MKNRNIKQQELELYNNLNLLLNVNSTQYTENYQDLDILYNKVLKGIINLFHTLDLQEPVSIFVAFITLGT